MARVHTPGTSARTFVADNIVIGQNEDLAADEGLMGQGIISPAGPFQLVSCLGSEVATETADTDLVPENLADIAALVMRKVG